MLDLDVIRYTSRKNTMGLFFINKKFKCYTLEDAFHVAKIPGETRIPNGRYRVVLRKSGGHHARYKMKFPEIHKGMLHIIGVPNYKYILIHIGNIDDDTEGCLLVGDKAITSGFLPGRLEDSTKAYKRIYPPIADAIEAGEEVWINYKDLQLWK
jgi:hypothetical protein